jgi:hypothetical protein
VGLGNTFTWKLFPDFPEAKMNGLVWIDLLEDKIVGEETGDDIPVAANNDTIPFDVEPKQPIEERAIR